MHPRPIDIAIVVAFNLGIVLLGAAFARRNRSAEHFMAAGRALPGWAVGLAIFGSYVSSISFLANPGKTFAGDWNPFVFSLALPVAAFVAARWFVPFYRRTGHVSAYQHLERRFGPWARTYAVACYLLMQLTRTGVVMYLLALALAPLLGWRDTRGVILALGVVMTLLPLLGGTEGAIWTGVVQSVVLVLGAVVALAWLVTHTPGGIEQVIHLATERHKFSLGSTAASLATPTIWVVLLYGLAENLRNFGVTQTYVQSYITAESDRAARRSVWLAAALYIPLSAVFFLIGTCLFAYFAASPGSLPSNVEATPDGVFPYYISHHLPAGLTGLLVAAVCAAATDSNFNSTATLVLCDLYKRYVRPDAGNRESIAVLRLAVLASGVISTAVAVAMMQVRNALDAWWVLAGIFSGGLLGLFLLGLTSRRAGGAAAAAGVALGVLVVAWMTLSLPATAKVMPALAWPAALERFRSPFDGLMIPVFGTLAVLLGGMGMSLFERRAETPFSLSPEYEREGQAVEMQNVEGST